MFLFTNHAETFCNVRLCLITFALLISVNTLAANIQVFTDHHHPIEAPADVHIIQLDAARHIKTELAAGLPADAGEAATIVRKRLKDGGAELQHRLRDSYQDITDAWSLGVIKIPAVVVDGQYVIYGETNVLRALDRIDAYRRARP